MKRTFYYLLLAFTAVSIFISCNDDDDVIVEPVNYTIYTELDEEFNFKKLQNVEITFNNTNSGDIYTVASDVEGKAEVTIIPGNYNITASINLTAAEFEDIFGYPADNEEVGFNGSLENIAINSTVTTSNIITLLTSRIGDLVIKQVYYAGSDVKDGASFRDVFFEIFNNSNEPIYLDGLMFAQLANNTSSTVAEYTLDNGQFDWSQSIGQDKGDKSNTDYCYADNVYRFPGSGEEHLLEPGTSVVVAGTAINHKEPLVVSEDKTYTVNNPDLVTDLSNADWEVNLIEYRQGLGLDPYITDIDNPNVPNIEIIHTENKELVFDPLGRDSFILFRSNEVDSYIKVPAPKDTEIKSSTRFYMQIPNDVIIDGVETNREDPSKLYPRRLSEAFDGGYAFVPKGKYSSQAIIRKIKTTIGDRIVLVDTNNSSNDFEVAEPPVPGTWK